MHFFLQDTAKRLLEGFPIKAFSLSALFSPPNPISPLFSQRRNVPAAPAVAYTVWGEMGSEERSSAMSQKISSLSRSNSSSSSKHDSRQVTHTSGKHCLTRPHVTEKRPATLWCSVEIRLCVHVTLADPLPGIWHSNHIVFEQSFFHFLISHYRVLPIKHLPVRRDFCLSWEYNDLTINPLIIQTLADGPCGFLR